MERKKQKSENKESEILQKLPEMVVTKAMLDAPLEFPYISTPILTCMNATPMTLPIRPFPSINIPSVKPIHPKTMPKSLPILPAVPASSCPGLYTIAIIFLIHPIPLKPTTHIIVVHSAPGTLALVKLTLIHVPVAVNLNPTPRNPSFLGFLPGPN
jgi:hypothetical protein